MKITKIDEEKEVEPEFPCLMENKTKGFIILVAGEGFFTNHLVGTIILSPNNTYPVGYYSEAWIGKQFKPYFGKLLIDNTRKQ